MRMTILWVVCLILWGCSSYDQFDDYNRIMHYYEEQSHYPIVHVYYSKHFRTSRQFADFLEVIEETEYKHRDYARFLLTDCDKIEDKQSQVCDDLRRTKDNHAVVGYWPSGQFIKYAGKKMQNPPNSRHYKHPSDVYKVEQLQNFLAEMMPNFYDEINSMQQFEGWLQPRYAPNLIFATREDDIPMVMAQLGVHYFLRFDMGYLSDLTEKVVQHLNITTFPALMVFKYNFENKIHELHRYEGKDFSTENYDAIKAFLEPLALKQARNDILFHKIRVPEEEGVRVTDSVAELSEMLDRASGWVLVSETKDKPVRLDELREKYGRFFGYIHYLNSSQEVERISLYDPEKKQPYTLPGSDIGWKALNAEEFISNTSALLSKKYVVIGVREKYSHFCTLAMSSFFKGLAYCFILKEEDHEVAQTRLGMKFQYGFVCYEKDVNGSAKVSGNNFNSDVFDEVYLTAEYQTRLKSKMIIDDFFEKPIKSVQASGPLNQLCNFPLKKCAFLFTRSSREDRTAYDYLKDVAKNFINEYQFIEIDLECNPVFEGEIEHLKKYSSGLVVYHPKRGEYVYLKAKLSRSTFERFLQANLADNKKLPFRKWVSEDLVVNKCQKGAESKKGKQTKGATEIEGEKIADIEL